MKKIAILYICTGKYNQFFEGFYESSEKFFFKNIATKHYFVFTNDTNLSEAENVTTIYKESKGFPHDSLFRFDMFIEIKNKLMDYDYIYFFNANMLFVAPVSEDILPKKSDLIGVIHPGYYNRSSFLYPHERNKESKAFIPYSTKKITTTWVH